MTHRPFLPPIVSRRQTTCLWARCAPFSHPNQPEQRHLLLAHPDAVARLDPWTRSRDFWVRRAALLSQIQPLKAGAEFDRFAGWADAMLDEREFFIRKAIGWVLREAGKSRAPEVYDWLLPRAGRASGVTIREAIKYLEPDQREAILAARIT